MNSRVRAVCWGLLFFSLSAQVAALGQGAGPVARMATKQFWGPEIGTYLEVQMAFDARSVRWVDAGEGTVRAAVEWTVIAFDAKGEMVDFRKSIARTERLDESSDFIDVVRLVLEPGEYALEWLGRDLAATGTEDAGEMRFDAPVQVEVRSGLDVSELFWVQAFATAADTPTAFTRGGRELLPLVRATVGMEAERLPFYAELYGSGEVFGSGEEFLVSAWFRAADTDVAAGEPQMQRYFKCEAAEVVPVFEMMELPQDAGVYDLVVDIRTRQGEPLVSRSMAFELVDHQQVEYAQVRAQLAEFVLRYTSRDSLWVDLLTLHPVAGANEQRTLDFTLIDASLAEMQGFMDAFWRRRNAEHPEAAWLDYKREVAIIDLEYKDCRNRPGHLTDQGSILLNYGRPNTIVKRHHGTKYYPYEIWHYYKAGQFNDKRFLFYSPMAVSACFELLHSDMPGFVQNHDWLDILRTREIPHSVHQTMLNGLDPKDSFSREEPEELFYNPK